MHKRMANIEDNEIRCSFCGKPQSQVERLIAGPDVYICNGCVDLCRDIIAEGMNVQDAVFEEDQSLPKPKEIAELLSQYVIGQNDAKRLWPLPSTITIRGSAGWEWLMKMSNCKRAIS